jgi:hypothetical protein
MEQPSASDMALYPTCWYSINNTEFIHCSLAILIVCHTMPYALSGYIAMFSLALSLNIGLVCFRACSCSMPVDHHGCGSRGARIVIMFTGMVPRARRIHRI